jgi:hypothetical protein
MQHKNIPSTVVYMLLIPISIPGTDVNGGMWLCYEVNCMPLAYQSVNFLCELQLQVLCVMYVILYFNSDILKGPCHFPNLVVVKKMIEIEHWVLHEKWELTSAVKLEVKLCVWSVVRLSVLQRNII